MKLHPILKPWVRILVFSSVLLLISNMFIPESNCQPNLTFASIISFILTFLILIVIGILIGLSLSLRGEKNAIS